MRHVVDVLDDLLVLEVRVEHNGSFARVTHLGAESAGEEVARRSGRVVRRWVVEVQLVLQDGEQNQEDLHAHHTARCLADATKLLSISTRSCRGRQSTRKCARAGRSA